MTDEQLLRDAAKAVGLSLISVETWEIADGELVGIYEQEGRRYSWAPHINDAVAFRLAVDLGISFMVGRGYTMASKVWSFFSEAEDITAAEDHDGHLSSWEATRVAIVRVAAEIGRQTE